MPSARSLCLRSHEVRGLLDGSVTQVRRVVKPQPPALVRRLACNERGQLVGTWEDDGAMFVRPGLGPFGAPGDVLVGREKWRPAQVGGEWCINYAAGGFGCEGDKRAAACAVPVTAASVALAERQLAGEDAPELWRSSTQMPRWAARLFLEVLEVRVERDEEGVWTWVARVKRTERPE